MNQPPARDSAKGAVRVAGLTAWLAAWPRGRWATGRKRWVQTALTVGLLMTGV